MFRNLLSPGLFFCLTCLPLAVPAAADPAKDYLFEERRFRNVCPPPLKFAAGACVPVCPAGFEDLGGYCRLRHQGSNSGRM